MTRLATSWLVYRLTDSPFMLGLAGFAGQIPALVLSPLAGVWADRWDRRRTMLCTQTLAMLQALALAALTLTGTINVTWLIALAFLQGVINSFETPARQAFVMDMIEDRADLCNAIALNSTIVNLGRLAGPAIAGVVIASAGEGFCFLIDGMSYIAVLSSLLAMKRISVQPSRAGKKAWQEFREGWHYSYHSPAIRSILLMLAWGSLVAMPFSTLLPIVANDILGGEACPLGFLTAAVGLGALVCAVAMAMRETLVGGKWLVIASSTLGCSLILFSFSRSVWVSLLLMFCAGFGMMRQVVAGDTILQAIVDDGKRGRVMSFYTVAVFGFSPIGSLIGGSLAASFGAPHTLMVSGLLSVLAAVWFWTRLPAVRRATVQSIDPAHNRTVEPHSQLAPAPVSAWPARISVFARR